MRSVSLAREELVACPKFTREIVANPWSKIPWVVMVGVSTSIKAKHDIAVESARV